MASSFNDPRKDFKKDGSFVQLTDMGTSRSPSRSSSSGPPPKQTAPEAWTHNPQHLRNDPKAERLMDAYDIILCCLPLLLMGKIVLCILASRRDKVNHGASADLAASWSWFLPGLNDQISLLYTILFITTLTTAVRRWALYKAQQGAYLVELEQLHASISLPSTIKMVLSLRSYGKLSVACKDEYTVQQSRGTSQIPLAWLRPDLPSQLSLKMTNLEQELLIAKMNEQLITTASYYTLPLIPTPYDPRGNPLIPILEQQESNIKHDIFENYNAYLTGKVITDRQTFATYSGPAIFSRNMFESLAPFDFSGNHYDDTHQFLGQFDMNTTYTLAVCDTPQLRRFDQFPNGTLPGTELTINITSADRSLDSQGRPTKPRQIEMWARWNTDSVQTPGLWNGSVVSTCHLTQSFITVGTLCLSSGCAAETVSYTPGHNGTVPSTRFDDDGFATTFFDNLLMSAGAPKRNDNSTEIVVESNMIARLLAMSDITDLWQAPYWQDSQAAGQLAVDATTFMSLSAQDLTKLINTYYMASQTVSKACYSLANLELGDNNPECVQITSKGSLYDPQFKLSVLWVVMDFLSNLVLFLAALFAW